MSSSQNPYRPPTPVPVPTVRTVPLRERLRGFPWTKKSYFRRGGVVIVEGIAFYLDPDRVGVVYAASPSAINQPKRMNLIISEVIRVLPILLADYPSLQSTLRGRKLVVRMVENYADATRAILCEESLEWDVVAAFLTGGSPADTPAAER